MRAVVERDPLRSAAGAWHVALASLAMCACDETPDDEAPRAARARPSATAPGALYAPPPPEGCARSGSLEAVASDPTCELASADARVAREALRRLTITVTPDPPVTVGGGSSVLRMMLTNASTSEVLVPLEAHPHGAGPRPNWAQLSGIRPPQTPSTEGHRLLFPVTTLDARERNVDGLQTAPAAPESTKLFGVRLAPGKSLRQVISWWAFRIPAPLPPFRNDAGYRVVPKTAPLPLAPGEYTLRIDLPLPGLSPEERGVSTRVRVERATPPRRHDAGR
jgi:hypothetical protein